VRGVWVSLHVQRVVFGQVTVSGLGDLAAGLVTLATPQLLFHAAWATLLGIFVGSLPGLTATMGVALMTTLTYSLDSTTAILVLICMYVGAIYGGSRSAILLNIPGTPASAATSLDGYPLAREGRAGYAMGLATTGSALGTLVGVLMLVLVAPPLAEAALNFGSFEFFWLAAFGILISGQLTADTTPIKGYIAGRHCIDPGHGRCFRICRSSDGNVEPIGKTCIEKGQVGSNCTRVH